MESPLAIFDWVAENPHRVVAAVLRSGRGVLLCHRRADRAWFPDVWDLPGGHVESAERERDAVVREIREELGVVVELSHGTPDVALTDPEAEVEMHIWIVDSWQGDIMNAAPEEHDEIRWVDADDLVSLRLAHQSYADMLQSAVAESDDG
jgi:mutator protein MutT